MLNSGSHPNTSENLVRPICLARLLSTCEVLKRCLLSGWELEEPYTNAVIDSFGLLSPSVPLCKAALYPNVLLPPPSLLLQTLVYECYEDPPLFLAAPSDG